MISEIAIHNKNNDIYFGTKAYRIWGALGWHDIKQRYRRSIIGPFWFTLSTGIMVVILGLLYSSLLNQEINTYLPYLATGLVVWQFLASSAIEGCTSFINSSYLIKQIRIPLTVHSNRIAWRNFVVFLHNLPVVIVTLIIFGIYPNINYFFIPFSLLILALHSAWLAIVLGILCARFRDIPPIVTNLVQIAFFFTPVMWSPEILKDRTWIVDYNPIYHTIEIVRAPILNRPIHLESWLWSIGFLIFGLIFSQYLMSKYRNRIPYWL